MKSLLVTDYLHPTLDNHKFFDIITETFKRDNIPYKFHKGTDKGTSVYSLVRLDSGGKLLNGLSSNEKSQYRSRIVNLKSRELYDEVPW